MADYQQWAVCPYCDKKQFPITLNAVIKGQFFKCRGSNCKRPFLVDTETGAGIRKIREK